MVVASLEKDLCKIWEVKTLGKERDAVARKLLEDAAKQVQPIMRKRKWQVPLLSEFCPRDSRLLGLNVDGGQKIMVRVRRSGNDSEFFPYESVLGTLLHELTHNECGPHDAKFYKLLDEITTECEQLMVQGISGTGEGFDAPGRRLGGYHHNPPSTALRRTALAAAEKRARIGALMPSGPRRLGGDISIMKDLSPVQAAAMAAERRQRDDVWCAAPVTSGKDGSDKVQEVVDAAEVHPSASQENVDVNMETIRVCESSMASGADQRSRKGKGIASVQDVMERAPNRPPAVKYERFDPLGTLSKQGQWQGTCGPSSSQQRPAVNNLPGTSQQAEQMWECSICTLLNPPMASVCGACGSAVNGQESQSWTCSKCTLQNSGALTICEACGAPSWKQSSSSSNPETAIIVMPTPVTSVTQGGAAAAAGGSKPLSPLGVNSRTWTCRQCTLENTVLLSSCEACDTWRFSHGPPVAARGPAGT